MASRSRRTRARRASCGLAAGWRRVRVGAAARRRGALACSPGRSWLRPARAAAAPPVAATPSATHDSSPLLCHHRPPRLWWTQASGTGRRTGGRFNREDPATRRPEASRRRQKPAPGSDVCKVVPLVCSLASRMHRRPGQARAVHLPRGLAACNAELGLERRRRA